MVLLPIVTEENKDAGSGFSLYIIPVVERIIGDVKWPRQRNLIKKYNLPSKEPATVTNILNLQFMQCAGSSETEQFVRETNRNSSSCGRLKTTGIFTATTESVIKQ